MSSAVPHIYRLLSAFSGEPRPSIEALEAAGLREAGSGREISDYHRGLLRQLSVEGRVRWVAWNPGKGQFKEGYVLTGYGEIALDRYAELYGPVYPKRQGKPLGQLLRERDEARRQAEQEAQDAS